MDMKKEKKKFPADLLPGILTLFLLPLIMWGHRQELPWLGDCAWYPAQTEVMDYFAWIRSRLLLFLAVWMLLVLFDRVVIRSEKKLVWKPFLFLAGAAILAVLSHVLSPWPEVVRTGMLEQYETLWVLLAYGVTAFYFAQMVQGEREIRILLAALLAGAAVQCVLGLFQMAGLDLWRLVSEATGSAIRFREDWVETRKVYLSLYNPNYAAVYIVMALPMAAAGIWQFPKKWQKGASAALAAALLICLAGTSSRTGFLILAAEVLAGVVSVIIQKKNFRAAGLLAAVLILTVGGYWLVSGQSPLEKVMHGFHMRPQRENALQEIKSAGGSIAVRCGSQRVLISARKDGEEWIPMAFGDDGEELALDYRQSSGRYRIDEDGLRRLSAEAYETQGIEYLNIYYRQMPVFFARYAGDTEYTYLNIFGKESSIVNAPHIGFEGRENWMSYRGYIWSRTLPLLKAHLLLGSGPDTFALEFPQNDLAARIRAGEDMFYAIVTKPHSMYLQTALQTGALSLILLAAFWIRILAGLIRKKEKSIWDLGLILAIAAYLASGVTNDSMVILAPVFWAFAGMAAGMGKSSSCTGTMIHVKRI